MRNQRLHPHAISVAYLTRKSLSLPKNNSNSPVFLLPSIGRILLVKILFTRPTTAFLVTATTTSQGSFTRVAGSQTPTSPSSHFSNTCRASFPSVSSSHYLASLLSSPSSLSRRSMSSIADSSSIKPSPPVARREEDSVIHVGVAPPNWNPKWIRQAESSTEKLIDPPVAVPNPYGWMRDDKRKNEEVIEYLNAENAYTESVTAHLEGVRETLYKELLSSVQETDYTTPRPREGWYYYTRTFEGKSYTVYCRAPKKDDNSIFPMSWDGKKDSPIILEEQVILDVNALAETQDYCSVGTVSASPSHKLLLYTADFSGDEQCLMFVKNLETGEVVDHDEKLYVYGSAKWGKDDNTLFYFTLDDTKRPDKLYRRKLNSNEPDELIFHEPDALFWTGAYKSLDGNFLFVEAGSTETTEIHFLDLSDPEAKLQCIAKRRPKVLYEVEHAHNRFWISSNVGGLPNKALFSARAKADCQDEWTLVKDAHNDQPLFVGGYDRSLDAVSCFQSHVVASGREGGLPRLWILGGIQEGSEGAASVKVGKFEKLSFPEDSHDVGMSTHYEFDTDKLVVGYDSMITPPQSLEIDMNDTTKRTVLKEKNIPGYDKSLYATERVLVKARDGSVDIPVSMVYRKDLMDQHKQGGAESKPIPTLLHGYGSYGINMEADFDSKRLPLLDRGMIYVCAHIRGGGEMGRQWYEEPNGGKYLCKKNTFNDFVDVAKWLVEDRKLTSPDVLVCHGRSAGGLLVGASINQAPELFKVAILGVPFVDLVHTMSDASIPLTTGEWEEWGNPNEEKFFSYMMEYSPPENIKQGADYPVCLLTCGFNDPRVAYWEATKFAAALRHQTSNKNPICVKVEMAAGHFSASDRYKYLREKAFDYSFLLDQIGLV